MRTRLSRATSSPRAPAGTSQPVSKTVASCSLWRPSSSTATHRVRAFLPITNDSSLIPVLHRCCTACGVHRYVGFQSGPPAVSHPLITSLQPVVRRGTWNHVQRQQVEAPHLSICCEYRPRHPVWLLGHERRVDRRGPSRTPSSSHLVLLFGLISLCLKQMSVKAWFETSGSVKMISVHSPASQCNIVGFRYPRGEGVKISVAQRAYEWGTDLTARYGQAKRCVTD